MKISTQSKYFLILFIFMIGSLSTGLAAMITQYKPLIVVFFAWLLVLRYCISKVKCPNCEMPISYQGRILGIPFYAGICRAKCANCDYDLTKEIK